jgi:hypothetical protein
MEIKCMIKGYNGLKIKDVWEPGDPTTRPKPDWVIMGLGDGAEATHYGPRKSQKPQSKIIPQEGSDMPDAEPGPTDWHAWVYGGEKNTKRFDKALWLQVCKRINRRDKYRCSKCGDKNRKNLTVHHIVPRSEGGETEDRNLITMCRKCHDLEEIRLEEKKLKDQGRALNDD